MKPKRIYLIRHGETDLNKNKIIQGGTIDASLNETGVSQAKQFYDAYKDEGIEQIFTSGLQRTHQSVQGFIVKKLPWEQFSGLNEISWGKYDGTALFENKYYWDVIDKWKAGETDFCIQSGESPKDVAQKQLKVIDAIKKAPVSKLLVCMHGRAMRILLTQLLGQSLAKMDDYAHNNLGLYLLDFDGDKFSIIERNNISHIL